MSILYFVTSCGKSHRVFSFSLHPSLDVGRRFDDCTDRGDSHEVGHRLRLGGRLQVSQLVSDCRGSSFNHSLGLNQCQINPLLPSIFNTHIVNDLSDFPSLEVGGRYDLSLNLMLGDCGSLNLLDGLSRSVGLGIRAGVGVDKGLDLRSSKGVLKNLGPVDDLGGNPDTSSRNDLYRGIDFGCGLEIGEDFCRSLMDGYGGGNDLRLRLIVSR